MKTFNFRKLFVLLALAGLFDSWAYASEARMQTLQYSLGVIDTTDVTLFPGMLPEFNVAIAELGNPTAAKAYGGIYKAIDNGGLGILVSRDDFLFSSALSSDVSVVDEWLSMAAIATSANGGVPAPQRPFEVSYGMKLGQNAAGITLGYATFESAKKASDGPTDSTAGKAQQLDMTLGYTIGGNSNGANRTDLGLRIGLLGKLEGSTETAAVKKTQSFERGTDISLIGRHIEKIDAGKVYVGGILAMRSPTAKADTGTVSKSAKFTEQELGLQGGFVFQPNQETLITAGLGALYMVSKGPILTVTNSVATPSFLADDGVVVRTTKIIVADLGTEAFLTTNFGFLMGLQYSLWGTKKTEDNLTAGHPTTEVSVPETPDAKLWSLGLAYRVDALRIDATFANAFLHNGPFFVTGAATPSTFAVISASYKI